MRRFGAVGLALVVLAGCGGDDEPVEPSGAAQDDAGDDGVADEPTGDADAEDAGEAGDDAPPSAPASSERCGPEASQQLAVGDTVEGEAAFAEPTYYCVEVPPGQAEVRFVLTGLTDDLDLFVGFDTFETVTSGGIGLRFSDNGGTDDELVTFTPSAYRGELLGFDVYADVTPGPYWIEVVGEASTYTLAVEATPA